MAHEIDMTGGKANMMYVGKRPWHGLGHQFESAPSIEQALVASGLDWKVRCEQNYLADGRKSPSQTTVRCDTDAILGSVGVNYTPLQNDAMLEWFRPFLESEQADLHTAGSLFDGAKVWCLAKIRSEGHDITGDGDVVESYILLSNSHDGSRAVRVGFTPIRVVCSNTLAMAHGAGESRLIKVLHTSGIGTTLTAIREVMNTVTRQFEATAEQYRKLARTSCNRDDMRKYVRLVLGVKNDEKMTSQAERKMGEGEIIACANEGLGTHGRTYWDAYNGVTEYLNYVASRTQDVRLDSLWFGQNAALSANALKIAIQLAG